MSARAGWQITPAGRAALGEGPGTPVRAEHVVRMAERLTNARVELALASRPGVALSQDWATRQYDRRLAALTRLATALERRAVR